jgi:hypothetical protein
VISAAKACRTSWAALWGFSDDGSAIAASTAVKLRTAAEIHPDKKQQ